MNITDSKAPVDTKMAIDQLWADRNRTFATLEQLKIDGGRESMRDLFSVSPPLTYEQKKGVLGLAYTNNLRLKNDRLDTIQDITKTSIPQFRGLTLTTKGTALDCTLTITGGEAKDAIINFNSDEGDDDADHWRLRCQAADIMSFEEYSTGAWTTIIEIEDTGIQLIDGSDGSPSYSFINDTDTGMYHEAANTIGFACNGGLVLTISNTAITFVGIDLDLDGNDLILDADGDSYLHASADDVVDFVLATATGELGITINGAEDFTFTANSFNVLAGSYITMGDDTWIGLAVAGGRIVFDSTPATDDISFLDCYVGIGTNAPTRHLQLYDSGTGTVVAEFTNATTGATQNDGAIVGIDSNEAALFWQYENDYMYFGTNNTERFRIHADGDASFVGDFIIGAAAGTNPASMLEIYDATAHPVLTITAAHATAYDPQIQFRTDDPPAVKWSLGVDGTDDNFVIDYDTGVGAAAPSLEINTSQNFGINKAPETTGKFSVGGALHCHKESNAFDTTSNYTAFVIGELDGASANNGGLYAIGRYDRTTEPFTALCGWDSGTWRVLYFGGGGWQVPDANFTRFYSAAVYNETNNAGIERMRVEADGHVIIGVGNVAINNVQGKKLQVVDDADAAGLNEVLWLSGGSNAANSGPSIVFHDYYGNNNYPTWQLAEIGAVYQGSAWRGDLLFITNDGTNATSVTEKWRITYDGHLQANYDDDWVYVGAGPDAGMTYCSAGGGQQNMVFDSQVAGSGDFSFINGDMKIGGANTDNPAHRLHVVASVAYVATFESTLDDATIGPIVRLYRERTGADNDVIGCLEFTGKDDGGGTENYGRFFVEIDDASAGTEDSSFHWQTRAGGADNEAMYLTSTGALYVDDDGPGVNVAVVERYDDHNDPKELQRIVSDLDRQRGVDLGIYEKRNGRYKRNVRAFENLLAGGVYQLYQKINEMQNRIEQLEAQIA